MTDVITTTDGRKLFAVRFEPGGEKVIITAANAVSVNGMAAGYADMYGIKTNGSWDIYPATGMDIVAAKNGGNYREEEE